MGTALEQVYGFLKQETAVKKLSLEKLKIKFNWHLYLPLLYKILNFFRNHQDEDAISRVETKRKGRGLRTFTLAPIYQNRNGYVNIDTSCLLEVYRFDKENRRDWVFPFDKDLIEKGKTTRQFFMETAEAC
jgi:hypothetical protein